MKSFLATLIFAMTLAIPLGSVADSLKGARESRLKSSSLKQLNQQSLGGVSDGGSTGIYAGNRLVLLDLYAARPSVELKNGSRLIVDDEKVLFKGKMVSKVSVKKQPAFKVAIQLMAKSSLPQALQAVIGDALVKMEVSVSKIDFPVLRATIPEWLASRVSSEQLATIALYGREEWYGGVTINERHWNELGELSQAGVLIHEALRHIQFVDENSRMIHRLSDAAIQDLTAQIVLKVPPSSNSTEMGWFLNKAMNNRVVKSQEVVSEICGTLREQFPMITLRVNEACEKKLPHEEIHRAQVLTEFSSSLTYAIADILNAQTPRSQTQLYMRLRDRAVMLSLEYGIAIGIKSPYEFIRWKADIEHSISDGSN